MKRNYHNFLFVISILFFITTHIKASHIVGGDLTYTFLSFNSDQTEATFQIRMTLYRDPLGIELDNFAYFGIFRETGPDQWESYLVQESVPRDTIIEFNPFDDPCKTRYLNEERLEYAEYTFDLTLEVGNQSYMVAYQKCCRNFSINNVLGRGELGAVYDVEISPQAQRLGNSSPTFGPIPPLFICNSYPLDVDHSATDIDGDRLTYRFCTPLYSGPSELDSPTCCGCTNPNPVQCTPPFPSMEYIGDYTFDNPLLGDPEVTIDNTSGKITGVPQLEGSFVVVVCVDEYRNGVLLGTVRRDFEFNSIACYDRLDAEILADTYLPDPSHDKEIAYYESCEPTSFEITNLSGDEIFIQDYIWQVFDENDSLITYYQGINYREVTIDLTERGAYYGQMILNDGASCFDTAFMQFYIPDTLTIDFAARYDTCVAGPVYFINLGNHVDASTWEWKFDDADRSTDISPQITFAERGTYTTTLIGEDSYGCTDSLTKDVDWYPHYLSPPDTIMDGIRLCPNDSLLINNQWVTEAGSYIEYIPSAYTGCDSIIRIINLEYIPRPNLSMSQANLCYGATTLFNNQIISEAGIYYDTLTTIASCDSIISLSVEIQDQDYQFINQELCPNTTYPFNNTNINAAGIYFDTLVNNMGCDSIIELQVQMLEDKEGYLEQNICAGETFIFMDSIFTTPGAYQFNLTAQNGCDSLFTLALVGHENMYTIREETICSGEFYTFQNENLYVAGNYEFVLPSLQICDSIVRIDLDVLENTEYAFIDTICYEAEYDFNGLEIQDPGLYFDTLTNYQGCDSVVALELIVGQNLTRIDLNDNLEYDYGDSIRLAPVVVGGEIKRSKWYETDRILSEALTFWYVMEKDNWVYYESTNDLYCVALDSIYLKSSFTEDIYIPNVFRPNGDGSNDYFRAYFTSSVTHSHLHVFDRWGNAVYELETTLDKNLEPGWNGILHGKPAEVGVYAYILEVEYVDGTSKEMKGTLSLLR